MVRQVIFEAMSSFSEEKSQRLLVVSNRLHITLRMKMGKLTFEDSVGGVATGLRSYLDGQNEFPYIWIGWPGGTVDAESKSDLILQAMEKYCAHPVFLAEEDMENFYHGFCNKTIWALFHYFPSYASFEEDYWQQYKRVNEKYCQTIVDIARPGDIVWVHDYHLMLLPQMLRERIRDIAIGFFLHIPFPSFEIFRLLPRKWRIEILQGLMGADLIGFHTQEYSEYFLRCVERLLKYEHQLGEIFTESRVTKVDTFPMGIDFAKFQQAAALEQVASQSSQLKQTLGDSKIVLSVDRLDYSKGILHRLRGYEYFLEQHPEWHEKITLVLIVVPSRVGVEHYQEMKKQIDELVGRINGRFGRISWSPILYQYRTLVFNPLVALYCIADVMLVTPLRDGMNLIAKEYLASRKDNTGVLILSEMAGAAKELTEAILINPNNIEEISEALKDALDMPVEEQQRRNKSMRNRLQRYDLNRWAGDFLQALVASKERQETIETKLLSSRAGQILRDFFNAKSRLILLDYDGTLVPFMPEPDAAKPDQSVLKIIGNLSADPANRVVLLSGRERRILESWFGKFRIGIVAEHGVWVRKRQQGWQLSDQVENWWKARISPIMEQIADRLPGAFVEEKEFSLVFHYRKSDPELALLRTKELTNSLMNIAPAMNLELLPGNKILEIRNSNADKGTAALQFLSPDPKEFIIAIGDDLTDEDLFRSLPPAAVTIHVGVTASIAKFTLRNPAEVRQFLESLCEGRPSSIEPISPDQLRFGLSAWSTEGTAGRGQRERKRD